MLHVAAELDILRLYFFFFFPCTALLQTIKAGHLLFLPIVSSNCHFLHRLPFTLTLDTLFLASSHPCWCEFTGESKGWESQRGNRLLLLCCLPGGRSAFYWWTSSWAQKSVRSLRKDTQYTHANTHSCTKEHTRWRIQSEKLLKYTQTALCTNTLQSIHNHLLFIHTLFSFILQYFFPLVQTMCDTYCASWRGLQNHLVSSGHTGILHFSLFVAYLNTSVGQKM